MITYEEALCYIFKFVNFEYRIHYNYDSVTLNLQRMANVLGHLGDPHRRFRVVHIAGTRGKGSTAAMVESCLKAAGFRTGLFTSPHLHTFRERIRVNGQMISQEALSEMVEHCQAAIEATPGVTTFEIMAAIAFTYFARQKVEWAVVEVGLGGRLDATNIVEPEVCGITSISYDHTAILGDTLTLIATEKAGIVKPGVPVISSPQKDEALVVIESTCQEQGASLTVVGRDWLWREGPCGNGGQWFSAGRAPLVDHDKHDSGAADPLFWIPLLGRHQLANATTALALIDQIRQGETYVSAEAEKRGLAQVRWPARMEVLNSVGETEPVVVVDGAQNRDSARKLRMGLAEWFSSRRWVMIFGASADHDIVGMWDELLPVAHAVVATASRHPRAAEAEALTEQILQRPDCPSRVEVSQSVDEALEIGLELAGEDDLVCVAGSLFVAAEAREAWAHRYPQAFPEDDWVHQMEPLSLKESIYPF